MNWKKRRSNLIVASLLSIIYTIVAFFLLIAPLHMNASGEINQLGNFPICVAAYWLGTMVATWTFYFYFKNKPELLFFLLIVFGILVVLVEIFLWRAMGL